MRRLLFLAVVVVFVASVGLRLALSEAGGAGGRPETTTEAPATPPALGFGETGGSAAPGSLPVVEEPPAGGGGAPEALPYVTEASFFAIIGFALGYASKKVVKLLLLLVAGLFVVIQGLGYLDVVTVDWQRAIDLANQVVLNVKADQEWKDALLARIPSVGSFVAGYALGFRKG